MTCAICPDYWSCPWRDKRHPCFYERRPFAEIDKQDLKTMPGSLESFCLLCRDMRKAQKEYFQTRNTNSLRKAKELEQQVDDRISAILLQL